MPLSLQWGADTVFLDIRTLMVMLALTGVLTSAALLIVRRLHLGIPGVHWWAWANAVCAAGLILVAGRGVLPDWLTIVIGNVLLLGSTIIGKTGCQLFVGRPGRGWLAPLCMVAMLLFLSWFTFVDDQIVLRIQVMFLASAFFCGWCGIILLKGGQSLSRRLTAWTYLLFSLFCVARAATVAGSQMGDYLNSGTFTAISFVGMFIFLLAVTLGQIVMTTECLQADLHRQATRDWLTDVLNRRAFRLVAEKELARVRRMPGGKASLLVMDLDHFKQINDRFGHEAGDRMLKTFVAAAQASLRAQDVFSRHGGEEFVALLPDTDMAGAMAVAERLRIAFAATRIQVGEQFFGTTVSIGVTEGVGDFALLDEMLRIGDNALYQAKAGGRDCIASATVSSAAA